MAAQSIRLVGSIPEGPTPARPLLQTQLNLRACKEARKGGTEVWGSGELTFTKSQDGCAKPLSSTHWRVLWFRENEGLAFTLTCQPSPYQASNRPSVRSWWGQDETTCPAGEAWEGQDTGGHSSQVHRQGAGGRWSGTGRRLRASAWQRPCN